MDPNAALELLRTWAKDVIADLDGTPTELDAAQALSDLDQWLKAGGFKPSDWA